LKIQLFNVLDSARDVQLKVESAQYRLESNAKKINRYIGKKANWYYQHKYSLRTGSNCEMDKAEVAKDLATLTGHYEKFYAKMLPALGKSTAELLRGEHDAAVALIKKIEAAERDEPEKPNYVEFKPDPKLVKQAKIDEEAMDELRAAKRKNTRHNQALRAAYEMEMKQWNTYELNRKGRLADAQSEESDRKDAFNNFAGVVMKMKKLDRDDEVTSFPEGLDKEIKAYDAGVKKVLANKTEQTPEENKAAIARNTKSQALAQKNLDATKARGKENQEVKQKLIW